MNQSQLCIMADGHLNIAEIYLKQFHCIIALFDNSVYK